MNSEEGMVKGKRGLVNSLTVNVEAVEKVPTCKNGVGVNIG